MATEDEIDDSVYSRQRYVLGDSAMQRMAKAKVLLYNLGGLGVEIAKNIVLAGIKSLTIQDSCPATYKDLGTQFFLREEDAQVSKNRAEASIERVAALNPYVSVKTLTHPLTEDSDLTYLSEFQCIVMTEAPLDLQLKVNAFCRAQDPQIKFISGDVRGLFCMAFCDFGDNFEVVDADGEEPKDIFIGDITKGSPGVLTTLQDRLHGLVTGDVVCFRELKGMESLHDKQCEVKVVNQYSFSICDTSGSEFTQYQYGGIATPVKIPKSTAFRSLADEISSPSLTASDLCKIESPPNMHLGFLSLHKFMKLHARLPSVWSSEDAEMFLKLAAEQNKTMSSKLDQVDEALLRFMSYTAEGCFAPLCASLGGILAQEVLKSLTGKFSPLKQWLHIDSCELLAGMKDEPSSSFLPCDSRYDALRGCIGEKLCSKLADCKLFMIGCGAIGCEMLKNYAMLGIGNSPKGQIVITDNDIIEKSNLNRQFLFHPQHIRKPKSTVAAQSTIDINPSLNIETHQHKVCNQTQSIFSDKFYENQDVIVNALDNLAARQYVDMRCVTTQRPLLESGTMGAKGHVQVIVPFLTESYSSQRDPEDEDVPYCTLKSFPAQIEHCIQWARDKFESLFAQKPQHHNKFWSTNKIQDVIQSLSDGGNVDGAVSASRILAGLPKTWAECVSCARLKFEKYFNYKAKNLLHAFPLDSCMSDGTLFWQSPRRRPCPVEFNPNIPLHMDFITACARILADINSIQWTQKDLESSSIVSILKLVNVPDFRSSSKKIVTDENASNSESSEVTGDDLKDSCNRLKKMQPELATKVLEPASFEKDDDGNGHIDYITASSNLRAAMYSLETADRLKTKKIAGRIVPAIATTTAAVAGLVSIELIKLLKDKTPLEHYKNCFMNLALPVVMLTEPGAVQKCSMSNGVQYTLWDRWDIHGNKDFTLQQFIDQMKEKYNVIADSVIHGVKMVYVPVLPGHRKRLSQCMVKLLKPAANTRYMDLVVGFTGEEEEDEGPSVRYHFQS